MKYLCLAYYDEKKFETLTDAEMAAIGRDCGPLDEDLQRSGHLLEVGSLGATKDSVCLRPRNGKVTVTDGPYAEAKEQVGSYFLIEARDLNEAIQVASKHPAARRSRPDELLPSATSSLTAQSRAANDNGRRTGPWMPTGVFH